MVLVLVSYSHNSLSRGWATFGDLSEIFFLARYAQFKWKFWTGEHISFNPSTGIEIGIRGKGDEVRVISSHFICKFISPFRASAWKRWEPGKLAWLM
jgi:hypothetical protein